MNTSTTIINCMVPPTAMLNKQQAFAYVNGIAIVINNVVKWTDEMVIESLETQCKLANGNTSLANISRFYGDIFGASHRKLIMEWMEKKGLKHGSRTALVAESTLLRGALTAYSWLTKTETKPFPPGDVDNMCKWAAEGTGVNPADVKAALLGCYQLLGKTP